MAFDEPTPERPKTTTEFLVREVITCGPDGTAVKREEFIHVEITWPAPGKPRGSAEMDSYSDAGSWKVAEASWPKS